MLMQGWTALTFAADGGHADLVKLLLAKGADANIKNVRVSDHAEAYAC